MEMTHKKNNVLQDDGDIFRVDEKKIKADSEAHQPAGDADHGDGRLGRLGDVEQVVEQSLVLVVSEQVELIQDEEHRAAAAAITWTRTKKSDIKPYLYHL